MSDGTGRQIKPLLYIEGKRLDNALISATTGAFIGKPSTASISLVPTESIKHILPRTFVRLAVNDPMSDKPEDPYVLFEGEVLGTGFVRNDSGRAFVIHCADVSNYWHSIKQYWFNLTQSGGAFLDQFIRMTTSGDARIETTAPFGIKEYLINRLNIIPESENLFMESLIALLDDIGNISSFYKNARRRLRITDRVLKSNAGQVQNLLSLSFMSDWLQKLTSAQSGETNLLTVISLLLNIIYHEYTPILAPPYVKGQVIKRDAFGNPIRKKDKKKINTVETEEASVMGNFIFKPHIYSIPPPTCNVLFPNMYSGFQYNRQFTAEVTRMTLTPQVVQQGKGGGPLNILRQNVFKRPMELDTFWKLYTSGSGGNRQTVKRPKSAKYGDGKGQSARVQEWEFYTNEERFKGINPSFEKLAPAPAIYSLEGRGKKGQKNRTGGTNQYTHNVASYEYVMRRFSGRSLSITGVPNIRPVPGFPMLFVDDSEAKMHMLAYLNGITHTFNATSGVSTSYALSLPRALDEIDLNRPIVDKKTGHFEFKTENGERVFEFKKMFSSSNQPPIPDWFDDNYKTIGGLTALYQSLFGKNVKSSEDFIDGLGSSETNLLMDKAVDSIVTDYERAKASGNEFGYVSAYTRRSFTTVNQAFLFSGAVPKNASETYEPSADEEYVGDQIHKFTIAEEDPKGESKDSQLGDHSIYNGKPIPHPFEVEIYEKSVKEADKAQAAAAKQIAKAGQAILNDTNKSPKINENAPTGIEKTLPQPVSYPLAEEQILKARRSIINSYRNDLKRRRGFRG